MLETVLAALLVELVSLIAWELFRAFGDRLAAPA